MSEIALKKLLKISEEKIYIPPFEILSDYWSLEKAAKNGGRATAEKYGGPGTMEGRKKGGKKSQLKRKLFPELYQNCNLRKIIKIPHKSSELSELIGIFLGDGGISNASQITITLNKKNDRGYSRKVKKIIENLFDIKPVIYKLSSPKSKNVIRLVVSSANLVDFLEKNGIKKGSKVKNQVDVPSWIKRNLEFSKSCLRGLVDTDGGVYYHRHMSNGCKSFNIGLCFTNKSVPLLNFVKKILERLNFNPKVSSGGYNIFLYREPEVLRYEKEIDFSNSYQKERIKKYLKMKTRKRA
ncbi:MAG: LAGLIDADG family homing endonuclease [Parcubacteria group bacterium]